MECKQCGCQNPESAKFCRNCGTCIEGHSRVNGENSDSEKRRKKNLYGLLIGITVIILRLLPIYGYEGWIQNAIYLELYIAIIAVLVLITLFSLCKTRKGISLLMILIAILFWGFVIVNGYNNFDVGYAEYSQGIEMPDDDTWVDSKDGKTYKVIKINGLVWMLENYQYKPHKGRYIELCEDQYSNVEKCGLLYNWETAKSICPAGWRLPTPKELINFFQQYGDVSYDGEGKYKSLFGKYNPDLTKSTFNKLMTDKSISMPNCNFPNNYEGDVLRSLLWTSEREEEDYSRAYAVYWRCDNPGVYFSSYPIGWFGFCRFVKEVS